MRQFSLALIFLVGCASIGMDAETMRFQGYQPVPMSSIVGMPGRPENQAYELWVKESRDAGRRVYVCLLPKARIVSFSWWLTMYVEGKEAWKYGRSELRPFPGMGQTADCTVSQAVPEGRLTYLVDFLYKAASGPGGEPQTPSPARAPRMTDLTTSRSGEAGTVAPSSALAPTWKAGYEWKFGWRSPRGSGTFVRSIAGEEIVSGVAYYVMRSGSREIFHSKDDLAWLMDRVEGAMEARASPPNRGLSWLLIVGKEWEVKYLRENIPQRTTEDRLRRYRVEAVETVTVPAGEFQAFRVTAKDPTGRLTHEYWYSPEAMWLVKERIYESYGVLERELLEYRLK